MPTYEVPAAFRREYERLPADQRRRFIAAVAEPARALDAKPPDFTAGLRVKRVRGTVGVWEMTFAPDGRATFAYGDPVTYDEAHVVWRRIGDHSVLKRP